MDAIDKPDTSNTDPAYWEDVLKSHKLSMDRGRLQVRRGNEMLERVVSVGSSQDVEAFAAGIRKRWQDEAIECAPTDHEIDPNPRP